MTFGVNLIHSKGSLYPISISVDQDLEIHVLAEQLRILFHLLQIVAVAKQNFVLEHITGLSHDHIANEYQSAYFHSASKCTHQRTSSLSFH